MRVNGAPVENTWASNKLDTWYTGDGMERVIKVVGHGGWHCGIDFDIIAEPPIHVYSITKI